MECFSVSHDPSYNRHELMGDQSRRVFEVLDFRVEPVGHQESPTPEMALHPPSIDPATPEGKRTRAKLLRAWVEVSSWLALYNKTRPSEYAPRTVDQHCGSSTVAEDSEFHGMSIHVNVESATEMYQSGIGAHVTQSEQLKNLHSMDSAEQVCCSCEGRSSRCPSRVHPTRPRMGDTRNDSDHIQPR